MEGLREIQTADNERVFVIVPKSFLHRKLEIIVMPVDDISTQAWPVGFIEQTAGCFASEPLVRGDQGAYEIREELA
ncbi:MAG: hypothetical protein WCI03_12930 [bacterium]|jgi:hypothetical protein